MFGRRVDLLAGFCLSIAFVVIAICSAMGEFKPFGTVDLTSNFMRPVSGEGVILTARIMRMGRSMAFCNTEIAGAKSGKASAFATGTYAIPQ